MFILYFSKVLMIVVICILLYMMFDLAREIFRLGIIKGFWNDVQDKYEERKKNREVILLLEGDKDTQTFIEKVDIIIEASGIRKWIPFITSEILIFITLGVAFISAFLVQILTNLLVFSLPVFALVIMLVILILKSLAKITYDKVDNQILIYINILENFAAASSDIVEIMEKSLPYLKEPLKSYSRQFTFECKKGIPIEIAFKNFENKIESQRFKQLLKNLAVCSKYEANYREILNKSRIILKNYFTEKERRKKEVREGRFAIVSVIIVGIFLFKLVESFTNSLFYELKSTFIGNIILGYNIFVLIYAVYKFITIDKINY